MTAGAALLACLVAQTDAVYVEAAGRVVIEVERAAPTGDWKSETAMGGHSGAAYFTWRGPDLFGAPGRGVLSYPFSVASAGRYLLRIRNRHDAADATLHNDCFTRMDDGEWIKTFSSQRGAWTWGTNHEDGETKGPASYVLAAGVHVLQISGRSSDFSIDRVLLTREGGQEPSDAELKESSTLFETLAGPGPYGAVAGLAGRLRAGRDPGSVLRELRSRKEPEARRMLESLSRYAEAQLQGARTLKDADPAGAVRALETIGRQFAGDDVGQEAEREAEAMRREPRVQEELKAEARWRAIEEARGRLKPHNGRRDPRSEGFRRLNAAALEALAAQCRQLAKAFPETLAAGRAEALLHDLR
jgi:hypothetical protein